MTFLRKLSALFCAGLGICAPVAHASAECDFSSYEHRDALLDPAQIEHVSVEIHDSRKWAKNSLSIIASRKRQISDRHKDKLKADITVTYSFGSCVYPARVRQSGDWKDHIRLANAGRTLSSIDVKLSEGNILKAVRFKLLLPESRLGRNEVLGTLLLSELGFIAPETFFIPSEINGARGALLFQENAAKELLERRTRREGPILEGDESLLWNVPGFKPFRLEHIALARLVNNSWAKKGATSTQISAEALGRLQLAYSDYASRVDRSLTNGGNQLVPNLELNQPTFENYAILLIAMNGRHALRPHNRKFYFNSFEQAFEPIYYDGDMKLDLELAEFEAPFVPELEFFLNHANSDDLEEMRRTISDLSNDETFRQRYIARSENADDEEKFFDDAMQRIQDNLTKLIAMQPTVSPIPDKHPVDGFSALREKLFANVAKTGLKQSFVSIDGGETDGVFAGRLTSPDGKSEQILITRDDLVRVMDGNRFDGKRVSLLPDLTEAEQSPVQNKSLFGGEVLYSMGSTLTVDHNSKTLTFQQSKSDDWALIRGADLTDWSVVLEGLPADQQLSTEQRFNSFGLTGCLNFYDSIFSNTRLHANQGQCEDSINIVSSHGQLDRLEIHDGFADALDIDFSELAIDNAIVNRTGNDCYDVSTGTYEIGHATLTDCGDKAVSVGEDSTLLAQVIDVNGSAIGISSKDFSRVSVDQLSTQNVPLCAEAFQKKQEFGGASLQIQSLICDGTFSEGPFSKIDVIGVTQ